MFFLNYFYVIQKKKKKNVYRIFSQFVYTEKVLVISNSNIYIKCLSPRSSRGWLTRDFPTVDGRNNRARYFYSSIIILLNYNITTRTTYLPDSITIFTEQYLFLVHLMNVTFVFYTLKYKPLRPVHWSYYMMRS